MDIYVGNLPYTINDSQLQELFSQYGNVASARVIIDKFTGKSKGFGFVEMPEKSEAVEAINALDGHDYEGRNLRVNESQPKPKGDRGDRGGDRGGRGGDRGGRGGDRGGRGGW